MKKGENTPLMEVGGGLFERAWKVEEMGESMYIRAG